MKGKLIVLTGIDGSGKTVQTQLLYERLKKEGVSVEIIDFPRYGETFFADLVARYLRGEFGGLKDVSPYLAATLFAGDRFETKRVLETWLDDGKVVIANRYVCDNVAHQGVRICGSNISPAKICEFNDWLTRLEHDIYGLPKSNLNVFLSVPPAIAYNLVAAKAERPYLEGGKKDIHEKDFDYLADTSKVFHILATSQPNWAIVECVDEAKILTLCSQPGYIPQYSKEVLLRETDILDKVWNCVSELLGF